VLGAEAELRVSAQDLDRGGLECHAAGPRPRVVIVPESVGRPACARSAPTVSAIVVLAREPTVLFGTLLLAAGVSCMDTASSEQSIVAGVRLAAQDACVFVSAAGTIKRAARETEPLLTRREIDVLAELSCGNSTGEIALRLGISVETVRKHTRKVLEKLGAESKRELIGLPVEWLL
jgi:DNA-binding NarL/FixJ family response regulator